MSFLGEYRQKLDAKQRTSVPSRYRETLTRMGETEIVIARSKTAPCLEIWPASAWRAKVVAQVEALPFNAARAQAFARSRLTAAIETTWDEPGRILLPEPFRVHAGIDKEVVFAGVGDHIELWSPESWDRAISDADKVTVEFSEEVDRIAPMSQAHGGSSEKE